METRTRTAGELRAAAPDPSGPAGGAGCVVGRVVGGRTRIGDGGSSLTRMSVTRTPVTGVQV